MADNSEYGLLTMMGGKLDDDLREINARLTLIEEKLELLLVRTMDPPVEAFGYTVEVMAPPVFSGATLTGTPLDEPSEDDD